MHTRKMIPNLACLAFACLALAVTPLFAAEPPAEDPPGTAGPAVTEAAEPQAKRRPAQPSALPEDIAGLQQAAIEAYQEGNYLRFVQATIKLRNLRPYEPQYMVGMVVGAALVGRKNTAYSYMHKMQQQGLSYDFDSVEDTASIRDTEVYSHINDLLVRAGDPLGAAEVAFTLPESEHYAETIAWDPTRQKFLVGTLDNGSVLAVSPGGDTEVLIGTGDVQEMWSVHGLVVDAERKRLWVATTAVPAFDGLTSEDAGRTALLGFDLETLEPFARHEVPADGLPHLLGSIAMLPGGDVYVIDRAVPMIYRRTADGDALEPYLANRELVGFRDIVASADGKRLYVADAALGILVVEPETQVSAMLAGPETLNLGGISGLMAADGALLVVQNGITPQRVIRLELDSGGLAVADVQPIANAMPPFNYPSFGVVHDEAAWYFASGNMPGANQGPVEPVVLKSPLKLEEGYTTPEQAKFRADTLGKESAEQKPED